MIMPTTNTKHTFAFIKSGPYYRRWRSLPMVDHIAEDGAAVLTDPVDALVTPYGYQFNSFRRPTDIYAVAFGEHAFAMRIQSMCIAVDRDGKPTGWAYVFAPTDQRAARLRYRINDLPASIKIDNGLIVDVDAHALGLDRPKRKSPRAV